MGPATFPCLEVILINNVRIGSGTQKARDSAEAAMPLSEDAQPAGGPPPAHGPSALPRASRHLPCLFLCTCGLLATPAAGNVLSSYPLLHHHWHPPLKSLVPSCTGASFMHHVECGVGTQNAEPARHFSSPAHGPGALHRPGCYLLGLVLLPRGLLVSADVVKQSLSAFILRSSIICFSHPCQAEH